MKTKGTADIPDDLAMAIAADPKLTAMWNRLRPSCQRRHAASVLAAKRPETRERRIAAVIRATTDWNRRHPAKKSAKPGGKSLVSLMDRWPDSWKGVEEDLEFGQELVALMRPFVEALGGWEVTAKTKRRHLDNLWAIGGEIVRALYTEPDLRKMKAREVLLELIAMGEAPLIYPEITEAEQRAMDGTAKRLLAFLESTGRERGGR
jgi:hypothetical protein